MVRITVRRVVGALAVAAIGFAFVLGFVPGILPTELRTAIDDVTGGVDVEQTMLIAGVVVAIIGLFSSWTWRTEIRSGDWSDVDAESALRGVAVTGENRTAAVEGWREEAKPLAADDEEPLQRPLWEIVQGVYARDPGHDGDGSTLLETGEWTEDRLAAAFLATDGVDYPLTHRLYAWLYPGSAYDRRTRRALRAVEDVCAEQYSGYEPPERDTLRLDRIAALKRAIHRGDEE